LRKGQTPFPPTLRMWENVEEKGQGGGGGGKKKLPDYIVSQWCNPRGGDGRGGGSTHRVQPSVLKKRENRAHPPESKGNCGGPAMT